MGGQAEPGLSSLRYWGKGVAMNPESPSLARLPAQLAAAVTDACASVSHNLNGQKLGKKGRVTRERILAAAIELIDSPDEPVTLSSVARRASLGMTSLYNYFTDLTELLLAVLEPVMATSESAYLHLLRERWPDEELFDCCYRFVRAYHDFWLRHSRLLHMRNALSDQRDARMLSHRIDTTRPIISLLVSQMGMETPLDGADTSMATMVMIGVERSITIATDPDLRREVGMEGVSPDRFLVPGARLMELAIRDGRSGSRYLSH